MRFLVLHSPLLEETSLDVRGTAVRQVQQGEFMSFQGARVVPPFPEGRSQVEAQDDLEHLVEPARREIFCGIYSTSTRKILSLISRRSQQFDEKTIIGLLIKILKRSSGRKITAVG